MVIVAMQLVGHVITNSLALNLKAINGGDVVVQPKGIRFSQKDVDFFDQLKEEGTIVEYIVTVQDRFMGQKIDGEKRVLFDARGVEVAKYPLYGQLDFVRPKGQTLEEVITSPDDVVLSQNLYARLDLAIGDKIILATRHKTFTARVSGVVRLDSQATIGESLEGYVLMARETMLQVTDQAEVSKVYLKTESDEQTQAVAEHIRQTRPSMAVTTTDDTFVNKRGQFEALDRFLKYVGLLALLIGGIGIVHTMQVVIGRRKLEIATLKALGYRGRHILLLFTTEATILGLIGSLLGLGLGVGLSRLVTSFALETLSLPLVWDIDPFILITALGVGVAVTVIFALLPVITASRERPYQVLYQRRATRPAAGCFLNGCLLVFLSVLFCIPASVILASLQWGIVAVYGTSFFLLAFVFVLGPLIWLVSKLPSLGQSDLKLALRNIGRQKARNVAIVLALTISVFALSLVILTARETLSAVRRRATSIAPFNVVLGCEREHRSLVEEQIELLSGLRSFYVGNATRVAPVTIKGQDVTKMVEGLDLEAADSLVAAFSALEGYKLSELTPYYEITQGRNLTPQDEGQNNVIVPMYLQESSVQVGDTIEVIGRSGKSATLQIVGFYDSGLLSLDTGGATKISYQAAEAIGGGDSYLIYWLDVDRREVDQAVRFLNRNLPGVALLNINDLFALLDNLFGRMTLLPKVLALLALFAVIVIIANSVALSLLERRRELGILKALGASDRRVLMLLLLENGILGILGGTLGVGVAYLFVLGASGLVLRSFPRFDLGLFFFMVVLASVVAVVTALFAGWRVVRIKPLEVLRYE
jgi:predicted lysophospholipase L1 biosynthesis ABC-type transport system permease subunit